MGIESPLPRRPLEALERRLGVTLGLSLAECAPEGVVPRLRHRIHDRALDGPDAYAEYLIHSGDPLAWDALAETLTANESRIFGSPGDFTPLLEMGSDPAWSRARPGAAPFRALSAGCGTGEEAYSLAIALAEARTRSPGLEYEVVGVDLSARAVDRARHGLYPASRGETMPPELRARWLVEREGALDVAPLRPRVRFARRNLCDEGSLRPLGTFDLALARGFLPTLTAEGRRAALANLAQALRPGGVLVLGEGDSIGDQDLGLIPVRWGERCAYARPGPAAERELFPAAESADPDRALVAHRSALVRGWTRILLEQRGCRVEEAAHATEALERIVTGAPPGLYLLERTLPPSGGAAVAERLPALVRGGAPVVLYLAPEGGPETLPLPLTRARLDRAIEAAAP